MQITHDPVKAPTSENAPDINLQTQNFRGALKNLLAPPAGYHFAEPDRTPPSLTSPSVTSFASSNFTEKPSTSIASNRFDEQKKGPMVAGLMLVAGVLGTGMGLGLTSPTMSKDTEPTTSDKSKTDYVYDPGAGAEHFNNRADKRA